MYIHEHAFWAENRSFFVSSQCPYVIDVIDTHGNHTVLFVDADSKIATIYFYDPAKPFGRDRRFVVQPGSPPVAVLIDSLEDENAMPIGTEHGDVMRAVLLGIIVDLQKYNSFIEFKHHMQYIGVQNAQGRQWCHIDSVTRVTGAHKKMPEALAEYFKLYMGAGRHFDQFIDVTLSDVNLARTQAPHGTLNICFTSAALAALYAPTNNDVVCSILGEQRLDERPIEQQGRQGLLRVAAEARMKEAMRALSMMGCDNPCWNAVIGVIRVLVGKTLFSSTGDLDLSHGQQDPSDVLMRLYDLYSAHIEVVSSPTKSFIAMPGYELVYKISNPHVKNDHFIHVELQRTTQRVHEHVFHQIRHDGVLYNLASIIQHIGDINSGHYIAYINRGGSWFIHNNLSDNLIRPVDCVRAMMDDINVNGKVFIYFKLNT